MVVDKGEGYVSDISERRQMSIQLDREVLYGLLLGAARLKRNTNACNIGADDRGWIAVPVEDFDALRAAVLRVDRSAI